MPYRKLPNSDAQLSTALDAAWSKSQHTSGEAQLLTPVQIAKLADPPQPLPPGTVLSLRAQFKKELAEIGPALSHQTDLTEDFEHAAAGLGQLTSHFIQVLNFAVQRGVFPRSDRAYYGLDVSGAVLPVLTAYADVEIWAQKLIDGEAKRLVDQPGAKPMAMPAAAEIAAALAPFHALKTEQSTAKDEYTAELGQVEALRPAIYKLIADLWDTIEFNLRDNDGPTLRRRAREWGVTYLNRPGETPDPDPEPTPAPVNPVTPTTPPTA